MNCSQTLIIIGLVFNTIASLIMLYPYLNSVKNIKDNIVSNIYKNGNYTQKKNKKYQKLGIVGFCLFAVGFIFQILGIIIV